MLERFTRPAREVVEGAVAIASDAGAHQVRPEHLFASLIWDEQCLAMRVLAAQGADVKALRRELDARRARYLDGLDEDDATALATIGIDLAAVSERMRADDVRPSRLRPRFSRPAKKTLELSLREALALRHNYIGTEHLLLGLVRQDDPVVRGTLHACGVDTDSLRADVAAAVRRAG